MRRVLKIKGMMCVHCEARVKKALEAIPGTEVCLQIERLFMVGGNFGRTIDDGCAKFEDSRVSKDLEYHFVTDTVGISLRDSHANFPFLFHML